MKFLMAVFTALSLYGSYTGQLAGAVCSLGMIYLCIYGDREIRKRDAEYKADPDHAKVPPDTIDLLESHPTEAGRITF